MNVHDVVTAVEPSVVQISASSGQGLAIGTGFIISGDGEIVTNAHVVSGSNQVKVRLPGETTTRTAQVVGADANADVALLKIAGVSNLKPVTIGSSNDVQVGDPVAAIGYALGLRGDPSVTSGIVSGKGRTLDQLTNLVQTDAPINPGNSGGPLVDGRGAVIAIDTAKLSGNGSSPSSGGEPGYENIGFAIPIENAMKIVDQLRSGGGSSTATEPGYLGISVSDTADGSLGALVQGVASGSPAAQAGLQAGDVIVAIDQTQIAGQADLSGVIARSRPGSTVTVTVNRGGSQAQIKVTLGTRTS
jgi:putative serine protease PepD